jgi:HK97 family phage major capsid protein
MPDNIRKTLADARLKALDEARAIAEEMAKEGRSAEREAAYDKANDDVDKYEALLDKETQRAQATLDAETREQAYEAAARAAAAKRGNDGPPKTPDNEVWENLKDLLTGTKRQFDIPLTDMAHTLALSGRMGREAEKRAEVFFNVGGSAAAAAGEGVELNPATFVRELYRALYDANPLLGAGVRIITTDRNEVLTLPKKVRSPKATSVAANRSTVVTQEAATIAKTKGSITTSTLSAIKYAQIVQATREFLDFSVFDGQSLMADDLGDVLGTVQAYDLTLGTKSATSPGGIVPQTTQTVAPVGSVAAGTFTHENILDMIYGVKEGYARNAKFLANRMIMRKIRGIKDGSGRYIYDAVHDPAQPDNVLGYPVATITDMATTWTNGTSVLLFGDLSKYYVRLVGSMRVEYSNDVYFENDLVGVKGVLWQDGDLFDTGATIKFVVTT